MEGKWSGVISISSGARGRQTLSRVAVVVLTSFSACLSSSLRPVRRSLDALCNRTRKIMSV